ncbi:hypothetical protein BDV28DRAFT_143063 [Aspergillus coremiiformis]|uniref:Uncharacterized protein n=1 Tax=Aspergillus coremiiformis TaxID=138285 RepID=A0A5N6YVG9_9EURO|nr:hypothetical protein BDV28DRAFT_143063 [Aspergillus coremiiformis]
MISQTQSYPQVLFLYIILATSYFPIEIGEWEVILKGLNAQISPRERGREPEWRGTCEGWTSLRPSISLP